MAQQRIEQPPQQLDLLSRVGEGRVAAQHVQEQPFVRLQWLGAGERRQQVETHPSPAEREPRPGNLAADIGEDLRVVGEVEYQLVAGVVDVTGKDLERGSRKPIVMVRRVWASDLPVRR
jgi:hypothetical protein